MTGKIYHPREAIGAFRGRPQSRRGKGQNYSLAGLHPEKEGHAPPMT